MIREPASKETARKPNMRETILAAAEQQFSVNGFNAVSVRDGTQAAGANPGSVTYHVTTKDGLLLEIPHRHDAPTNLRRSKQSTMASFQPPALDRPEAARMPSKIPASAGPPPR